MRSKYKSPRSVAAHINLPELQSELSIHPPAVIALEVLAPPVTSQQKVIEVVPNGLPPSIQQTDNSQGLI